MSKVNYFSAQTTCPHCDRSGVIHFEADIGVLDLSTFEIGDLVIKSVPPEGRPIGPALDVEWERPFWAVGFGTCPQCRQDVVARIEIRDRRFSAAQPTLDTLDTFAWGYLPR
jgi:hypothetical protein